MAEPRALFERDARAPTRTPDVSALWRRGRRRRIRRQLTTAAVVVFVMAGGIAIVAQRAANEGQPPIVVPGGPDTTTVATGRVPLAAIAVAFAEGLVWVLAEADGTLVGIDPVTMSTVRSVDVAVSPGDLVVAASELWLTGTEGGRGVLQRVDPATGTVTATVPAGNNVGAPDVAAFAHSTVWTPGFDDALVAVDVATLEVRRPTQLAVRDLSGLDGLWVLGADGRVSVVDEQARELVAEGPSVRESRALAARDREVWVAALDGVTVVSVDTLEVIAQVDVPRLIDVSGIAVDERWVWITGVMHARGDRAATSGVIARIDRVARRLVELVEVDARPGSLAIGDGHAWTIDLGGGPLAPGAPPPTSSRLLRVTPPRD